jgi:hypothetical protein
MNSSSDRFVTGATSRFVQNIVPLQNIQTSATGINNLNQIADLQASIRSITSQLINMSAQIQNLTSQVSTLTG